MTTDIIAACVLGLWIALGFALHKYFEWQRWDEDRRIERIRYVTACDHVLLSEHKYAVDDATGQVTHISSGLRSVKV